MLSIVQFSCLSNEIDGNDLYEVLTFAKRKKHNKYKSGVYMSKRLVVMIEKSKAPP